MSEVLYKNLETLFKINVFFSDFIKIRGKNMLDQLEAEIFNFLEEQFNNQTNAIDTFM
jgi:hypothetical protein